jgi:hypothetical protein
VIEERREAKLNDSGPSIAQPFGGVIETRDQFVIQTDRNGFGLGHAQDRTQPTVNKKVLR